MARAGGCERCGGNRFIDVDEEGDVWATCLQCSRSVPWSVTPPMPRVRSGQTYDTEPRGSTWRCVLPRNPRDTNHWSEDGCDLHGSCFTCPLPACRYDMVPGRAKMWAKALAARPMVQRGASDSEIAAHLGISRRTVYRVRNHVRMLL